MKLFRQEAINQRRHRLHGSVRLDQSIASWILTVLALLTLLACCSVLASRSYSQTESAPGVVVPSKGIARIASPRPGSIIAVLVEEGQRVRAGQALVALSFDEHLAEGVELSTIQSSSLNGERLTLQRQIDLLGSRAHADQQGLEERRRALLVSRRDYVSRIALQQQRLESARDILDRYLQLQQSGLTTSSELTQRRDNVLSLEQGSMSVRQELSSLDAQLRETDSALTRLPLDQTERKLELQRQLASLDGRAALNASQRGTQLVAPLSGTVLMLPLREGQRASPASTVAAILPLGSKLEAEILLATRARGFIEIGQQVFVKVDAFPHRRYGTLSGTVSAISGAAYLPQELGAESRSEEPVYRVLVSLERDSLSSKAGLLRLRPGMTLHAEIVRRRQSLLDTLFPDLS